MNRLMLPILFLALAACTTDAPAKSESASKPNIVFILTDDQNPDTLGCFGGKVLTPTLDTLCRDGVKFTHAYNSSSVCTPSRRSGIGVVSVGHPGQLAELAASQIDADHGDVRRPERLTARWLAPGSHPAQQPHGRKHRQSPRRRNHRCAPTSGSSSSHDRHHADRFRAPTCLRSRSGDVTVSCLHYERAARKTSCRRIWVAQPSKHSGAGGDLDVPLRARHRRNLELG